MILKYFGADYEGSIRLLEIAQVPSEHAEEFKSGDPLSAEYLVLHY